MADDVLLNKAATIERRVKRAREEFTADPDTFASNFTRQDAAILNIQRACEAVAAKAESDAKEEAKRTGKAVMKKKYDDSNKTESRRDSPGPNKDKGKRFA